MHLLASGGVTMAAGAMISLSFAVSPPVAPLPPHPATLDVNGNVAAQQQRSSETVGAAVADSFKYRWQPTDEVPLMPVPRRDLLEGLVGGLLTLPLVPDAPQLARAEASEPADALQPEQREAVTAQLREQPARPSDICARHGLHRVNYTQNHHRYWRCAGRR